MADGPEKAGRSTYARGPDGKTPLPANFPEHTRKIDTINEKTGRLLERGMSQRNHPVPQNMHFSSDPFLTAQREHDNIAVVKQDLQDSRMKEEYKRQQAERASLGSSYSLEKGRFEGQWASEAETMEEKCDRKLGVLKEVHEIQLENLEVAIASKIENARFKASCKLLELEDMSTRLGRCKEFKQAAEVGSRAHKLRKEEEAAFERALAQAVAKERAELAARQVSEMRVLMQKCHGLRVGVSREREKDMELLQLRYRNLECDLTHAHALEPNLPAEIGFIRTYRSRGEHASTFRGTLKFEALAGTKFDCPAVSQMPPLPPEKPSARGGGVSARG